MIIKAVLFDLDGTLVDSRAIEHFRTARRWKDCVKSLDRTACFPEVNAVLAELRKSDIKTAVVTTSVSYYAQAICKHHGILYDTLVAYHDAPPKPAPDPFLKALERLGVAPENALGIGDDAPDSLGLTAAAVLALGAGWSPVFNPEAKWKRALSSPSELLKVIGEMKS